MAPYLGGIGKLTAVHNDVHQPAHTASSFMAAGWGPRPAHDETSSSLSRLLSKRDLRLALTCMGERPLSEREFEELWAVVSPEHDVCKLTVG